MRKSELIAILQALPGDPPIMVEGYEGGLSDILEDRITFAPVVFLNYHEHDMGFFGRHEESSLEDVKYKTEWEERIFEATNAYIIRR